MLLKGKTSGFDRGHMSPAADNKCSKASMQESFLLSNVVPQDNFINRGIWNDLEMFSRSLVEDFDFINVITGPIMRPIWTTNANGKAVKTISYQVIGDNEVAVPTHLFKILICVKDGNYGNINVNSDDNNSHDNNSHDDSNVNNNSAKWKKKQKKQKKKKPLAPSPVLSLTPLPSQSPATIMVHSFLVPNDLESKKGINFHQVGFDDFRTPLEDIEKYSGFQFLQRS